MYYCGWAWCGLVGLGVFCVCRVVEFCLLCCCVGVLVCCCVGLVVCGLSCCARMCYVMVCGACVDVLVVVSVWLDCMGLAWCGCVDMICSFSVIFCSMRSCSVLFSDVVLVLLCVFVYYLILCSVTWRVAFVM